ncbi:MAG: ACT domain-containing protein [Candidatus Auribacterota bacterium]|jgi:hypothetical protein
MSIIELAIFMEDRVGRLYEITRLLADNGINIRGFSVADSGTGFGIFRLITSEYKKAYSLLKEKGFVVHENKVICANVPDEVGGIAGVLNIFNTNNISVQDMYAIVKTLIIFDVDNVEDAAYALKHNGIEVISQQALETI